MSLELGAIVEAEIRTITNFGAFVQLSEGKSGLLHISEVANSFVKDVREFIKEKDKVKVKIISIDEKGKIAVSMKKAVETPAVENKHQPRPAHEYGEHRGASFAQASRNAGPLSFEDKLSRFLKDSDSKISDLKKNTDGKRGGRGARRG